MLFRSERNTGRISPDFTLACREHVVTATSFSPFKVRDHQRGTDRVRCRENLRLSLPSPAITWIGEVGGINCGGDMGVRRCLARFLTSLEPLRTPKIANGLRSTSFRPDSPLTTTSNRGRKSQPAHLLTTPDASSKPQLNLISQIPQKVLDKYNCI